MYAQHRVKNFVHFVCEDTALAQLVVKALPHGHGVPKELHALLLMRPQLLREHGIDNHRHQHLSAVQKNKQELINKQEVIL